jgi:hypothetical protein
MTVVGDPHFHLVRGVRRGERWIYFEKTKRQLSTL